MAQNTKVAEPFWRGDYSLAAEHVLGKGLSYHCRSRVGEEAILEVTIENVSAHTDGSRRKLGGVASPDGKKVALRTLPGAVLLPMDGVSTEAEWIIAPHDMNTGYPDLVCSNPTFSAEILDRARNQQFRPDLFKCLPNPQLAPWIEVLLRVPSQLLKL
jgi:hypothetical protein